jgi:hypothetical protein
MASLNRRRKFPGLPESHDAPAVFLEFALLIEDHHSSLACVSASAPQIITATSGFVYTNFEAEGYAGA